MHSIFTKSFSQKTICWRRRLTPFVAVAVMVVWVFSGSPQIFNFPPSVPLTFANGISTFTATTSDQTFAVPEGVTSIIVKCWGGGGQHRRNNAHGDCERGGGNTADNRSAFRA